jgi:peptidoglycan/xylan/chitin deacetylase (PgdA/CDA1 family)
LPVDQWHHPLIVAPFYLAAGAVAAAWSSPALAPVVPTVADALRLPRRGPDPGAVSITFDDGPHPEGTPAVLEVLREADAKATFFLIGENVERYPSLAGEIASEGHTVAVHGQRHRNMLRLTPSQFSSDLDRAEATIGEATGADAKLYRPPYGIFSPAGLAICRRRELEPMLWSRWGHDWRRRRAPEKIVLEVTENLRGGDVLLLHDADHYSGRDCWRSTVAAIPMIVAAIHAAGLRPAAL